jgi:hypothetical protein
MVETERSLPPPQRRSCDARSVRLLLYPAGWKDVRIMRHVGRFGSRGFTLRLATSGAAGMLIGVPGSYWEIDYEGQIYPWRPLFLDKVAW